MLQIAHDCTRISRFDCHSLGVAYFYTTTTLELHVTETWEHSDWQCVQIRAYRGFFHLTPPSPIAHATWRHQTVKRQICPNKIIVPSGTNADLIEFLREGSSDHHVEQEREGDESPPRTDVTELVVTSKASDFDLASAKHKLLLLDLPRDVAAAGGDSAGDTMANTSPEERLQRLSSLLGFQNECMVRLTQSCSRSCQR